MVYLNKIKILLPGFLLCVLPGIALKGQNTPSKKDQNQKRIEALTKEVDNILGNKPASSDPSRLSSDSLLRVNRTLLIKLAELNNAAKENSSLKKSFDSIAKVNRELQAKLKEPQPQGKNFVATGNTSNCDALSKENQILLKRIDELEKDSHMRHNGDNMSSAGKERSSDYNLLIDSLNKLQKELVKKDSLVSPNNNEAHSISNTGTPGTNEPNLKNYLLLAATLSIVLLLFLLLRKK